MGDLDRERYRRLEPADDDSLAVGRREPGLPGEAAFLGLVTTLAPAVGHYCLVTRQTVGGTQTEGSAGAFVAGLAGIPVYLVGPAAPVTGDLLVCRWSDHRWVAERGTGSGGGGGIIIPGCPCSSSPATLHMTSTNPSSNNHMFQNATIVWGPTPAGLSGLGYRRE